MKKLIKRLIITLAIMLSGCASVPNGYYWNPDPVALQMMTTGMRMMGDGGSANRHTQCYRVGHLLQCDTF